MPFDRRTCRRSSRRFNLSARAFSSACWAAAAMSLAVCAAKARILSTHRAQTLWLSPSLVRTIIEQVRDPHTATPQSEHMPIAKVEHEHNGDEADNAGDPSWYSKPHALAKNCVGGPSAGCGEPVGSAIPTADVQHQNPGAIGTRSVPPHCGQGMGRSYITVPPFRPNSTLISYRDGQVTVGDHRCPVKQTAET
jgi:hypothetical protein